MPKKNRAGSAGWLEDNKTKEFLKSDYRETLKDFKPRFGQEGAIANITENLLKYNKCLFAGHTGIGKTLISEIATLRYFSAPLSGLILLIGFFMIGFTKKKQGLHDIFTKTLHVNN